MLKVVSKAKTRTFSGQDEKLTPIKDLKMPMARFMNGILIGQAIHSWYHRSEEQNEPDSVWKKSFFPSHYVTAGSQIHNY